MTLKSRIFIYTYYGVVRKLIHLPLQQRFAGRQTEALYNYVHYKQTSVSMNRPCIINNHHITMNKY